MRLKKFSQMIAVAIASVLLSTPGPAKAAMPEPVADVIQDLGMLSVNVPLWLARAMPGGVASPLIGVTQPGEAGSWGLRLIIGQAAILSRFNEAVAGIETLDLAKNLSALTIPWAQAGLAGRWTPSPGLSLELGARGLPPIEVCTQNNNPDGETVKTCVALLNVNAHMAMRWEIRPPDGGMPGLQLGASIRAALGSLSINGHRFSKHTEGVKVYHVAGAPKTSWLLGQAGIDLRFHWRTGPVLPFVGTGLDLTIGTAEFDTRTELSVGDLVTGEVTASPVEFPDYPGHPALLNLRFYAGADFELGAGFSLSLQGGVTFLGFVSPDDPDPSMENIVAEQPEAYLNLLRSGEVRFQAIPVIGLALDWHDYAPEPFSYFKGHDVW